MCIEDWPLVIEEQVQILRELYAAINGNDPDTFVSHFDSEIDWIEPKEYAQGGTHHGIAATRAHMSAARATWAEGTCEPVRFIPGSDDRIVVAVHVRVRLREQAEWLEGDVADVFTFKDGRIVQMRHFPEFDKAVKWAAGMEE